MRREGALGKGGMEIVTTPRRSPWWGAGGRRKEARDYKDERELLVRGVWKYLTVRRRQRASRDAPCIAWRWILCGVHFLQIFDLRLFYPLKWALNTNPSSFWDTLYMYYSGQWTYWIVVNCRQRLTMRICVLWYSTSICNGYLDINIGKHPFLK